MKAQLVLVETQSNASASPAEPAAPFGSGRCLSMLFKFLIVSCQSMHACDVFVCLRELVLAHAAHYLVKQLVFELLCCCFQQEMQFVPAVPGLILWCVVCGHRCFFLIAFSARTTACSMLLLRSLIRLNSSQLILGVLSCSHACLRRLCFVSFVICVDCNGFCSNAQLTKSIHQPQQHERHAHHRNQHDQLYHQSNAKHNCSGAGLNRLSCARNMVPVPNRLSTGVPFLQKPGPMLFHCGSKLQSFLSRST